MTTKTEAAARKMAASARTQGVGIGIEILMPIIATVLQTLITSCVKGDGEKADRLKAMVTKAYQPKHNRYRSPIVARFREVIRQSARGKGLKPYDVDATAIAMMDEIRLADDTTAAAVCAECGV